MHEVLRDGLLAGTAVLAAPGTGAAQACARLGADVRALEADLLDEVAVEAAVAPCQALVVDAGGLFGAGGPEGLRAALDGAWCAMRATVNASFLGAGSGKIVLVAPRPGAGEHAEALRAGVENLARTTSVEWARYAITPTAVLPGPQTADAELAEVVAYLVSPAGDYFAGCVLALD